MIQPITRFTIVYQLFEIVVMQRTNQVFVVSLPWYNIIF